MAQSIYPISLQEASFPMLSTLQGRTVIGNTIGKSPSQLETPAVAYCHNVMPTKEGYESIGYLPVIDALATDAVAPFSDVRIVYGSEHSRLYMVWDALGNAYVLLPNTTSWLAIPTSSPSIVGSSFDPDKLTIGTVNGISYIFYARVGAFIFNEGTNSLDFTTLTGITLSTIIGCVGSGGYLVLYTELAIAWSSTIDPTDFVPSTVTGAGGGNIAGLAGPIMVITTNSLGLLVYTKANILAGTLTGTVTFPWRFRVVPGGKGAVSLDLIAYEAGSENQYVYSKAGLQSVGYQRADVILPEVTDFLAGKKFEDFNEATKLYEYTDLISTMKKKLKYIASRYLVISYGINSFTHAIVIDTALNRYGKLRLAHTDCFEYVSNQQEIAKEELAFLTADGSVSIMDVSDVTSGVGVIIVGKLQPTYTRWLTLLEIQAEAVSSTSNFSITVLKSLDGRTTTPFVTSLSYAAEGIRKYVCRATANNHSLALVGDFNVSTLLVTYMLAGRR